MTLEEYLAAWDEQYLIAVRSIPLFDRDVTQQWTLDQRQYFVKLFFHLRGHFGEVLWALGTATPDADFKEIILENIRDEFGGKGKSHEQLFQELASSLGCDLSTEYVDNKYYLPFARLYNQSQLQAIAAQDWNQSLIGFAAGEHLDSVDYAGLRGIFESFGLNSNQLAFFRAHTHSDHFSGAVIDKLRALWDRDMGTVQRAFDQVRQFQISMWREFSDVVCRYRPESAPEVTASGSSPEKESNYDSTTYPAFSSRYADLVAFDRGDPSSLELVLDDAARQHLTESPNRKDWGRHVLVFGGNGFVGCHLVHQLLRDPRVGRVTALVRSRSDASPNQRILRMWLKYELSPGSVDLSKLTVLEGSMCAPRFGLSEERYKSLAEEIDTVFQAAGTTDYVPTYLDLRNEWVLGLLGVLQFCFHRKMKQIVYIGSTIAHLYKSPEDFRRPDSWWYSGYTQMKWVNQHMIASLQRAGMRAVICEAPYILGSTTVGRDPGFVYSWWRGISMAAVMQIAWDGEFPDFSPVDFFVETTVENALAANPKPILRPMAPWRVKMSELAPLLNCKLVSWDEFYSAVKRYANADQLRMVPDDGPDIVSKTRVEPIYPAGIDVTRLPKPRVLAELYLDKLNLLSTTWHTQKVTGDVRSRTQATGRR
jgi:pyrroloquinoline quinone (PQQ) biosynthesis protein C